MAHEPGDDFDPVVVRLRRSHAFGIAGLLAGVAIGIALGTTVFDDSDETTLQLPPGVGAAGATPVPAPAEPVDVAIDGRPAQGPVDAKVTLVEFLDYECPFCQAFFDNTLPRIRSRYGDRVRFVVRNFPLDEVHPRARAAAYAAECALAEGRFWPYHDKLFASKKLDSASLRRHAEQVGIDGDAFEACLHSPAPRRAVRADVSDGQSYSVTATPTFFINGRRLEGAHPFERIAAEIEKELD